MNSTLHENPTTDYDLTTYHHEMSYFSKSSSEQQEASVTNNLDPYQQAVNEGIQKTDVWVSSKTTEVDHSISPKQFDTWIKRHANEQEIQVQNSAGITRKKSILSYNSSLAQTTVPSEEEEDGTSSSSSSDEDEEPPPTAENVVTSKQAGNIPDIDNSLAMTTKSKKSWFINLIQDLKKTHKLFTSTRKSSITPDTTAKKQRSLDSFLKRKKTIPLETLDSPIVHTRYPIQTEHAIYRLSHLKLCSSQRPLQQQVVISNLMYWYLSISNTQHSRQKKTSANASINSLYMQKTYHTPTPKQQNKKADKYKPIKNTEYNPRS